MKYHVNRFLALFVMFLTGLILQHDKKWNWLVGVQKKGMPVVKEDLLKYLSTAKEPWLLKYLCTELKHRDASLVPSKHDILLNFLASTIMALLYSSKKKSHSGLMVMLLPPIAKCLQSQDDVCYATACVFIASLCQLIKMPSESHQALAMALAKSLDNNKDLKRAEDCIKALAVVLTAHNMTILPNGFLDLFRDSEFKKVFLQGVEKYKIKLVFWVVWETCVEELFQRDEKRDGFIVEMMVSFLEQITLEKEEKCRLVTNLVNKTLKMRTNPADVDVHLGRCLSLCRYLEPMTWNTLLFQQGAKNDHMLERLDLVFLDQSKPVSNNEVDSCSVPERRIS